MKRFKPITSLRDLFDFVNGLESESKNWVFRGQAKADWKLVPKIGRKEYVAGYSCSKYTRQFERWTMFAENYLPLPDGDWRKLAIAQHFGLPTHFLDWSTNPLIALFFAVNDHNDAPGSLFALNTVDLEPLEHEKHQLHEFIDRTRILYEKEPVNDVWLSRLRPTNGRIVNQNSLFTFHRKESKDLRESIINSKSQKAEVISINVDRSYKRAIHDDLDKFGINYTSVFPDIEGITKQISLEIKNGIARH
jgi:hypothetical protein